MRSTRRLLLLVPVLAMSVAAAPWADVSAVEMIREGNEAVARGDYHKADEWYTAAEEVTTDPGLVAFNKANALFHRDKFAVAEQHYTRSLDDADAPPARRAAALYNRGVCLLKQGGLQKLRTAIDSFDRCLMLKPGDALVADARHNLELAKLLWAEARAKESNKPDPNEKPPDAPPEPKREQPAPKAFNPFSEDPLTADGNHQPTGKPQPVRGPPTGTPQATDKPTPGHGNAQVLNPSDRLPDWDDRQVRKYLELLAVRVAKDRRDTAALTAPPERPSVKDW